MRSSVDLHASVLLVGVVDRQPDRHRLGWCQWPVTAVLVPVDILVPVPVQVLDPVLQVLVLGPMPVAVPIQVLVPVLNPVAVLQARGTRYEK